MDKSNIPSISLFLKEYKIEETLNVIKDGGYKVIALQFSDDMLCDSDTVLEHLSRKCESEFYILGDTTFSSCCVDEVAARHIESDLVVHYGNACLSRPKQIPCYYVIPNKYVDTDKCIEAFKLSNFCKSDTVFMVSNPSYQECSSEISSILHKEGYINVNCFKVPTGLILPSQSEFNFSAHDLPPDSKIFYIGSDNLHLFNISITNARSEIIWFEPTTSLCSPVSCITSMTLQSRYFQLESARDANIFGIVIGTLGQSSNLNVLEYTKKLLKKHGKKSYTIAVGKPNPQKLGNFLEVNCFVLLACPESSFLDSKAYFRPVITLYELVVALESLHLDLRYIVSAHHVISTIPIDEKTPSDTDERVQSDSSELNMDKLYISTKFCSLHKDSSGSCKNLQKGCNSEIHLSRKVNSAAEFLSHRTYKGLEYDEDEKPAATLKIGRHGCASGYDNELF